MLKIFTAALIFAAALPAATIDQWKLTYSETNNYTYEQGPFIGSYAYFNLYEPLFEANPQTYITWGYTACPDPCYVAAPRLTNPLADPTPGSTVPEPATLWLVSLSSIALYFSLRRTRKGYWRTKLRFVKWNVLMSREWVSR